MTTKEYFSQALWLDKRINSKLEHLSVLKNLATKATASIHAERVSGTRQRSPMENAIVKVIDLENEINDDIDKLVDLKREITQIINLIENSKYKVLMELRYLSFKTWEEIADELQYDLRWVYKLHGKALLKAEKHLNKNSIFYKEDIKRHTKMC